MTGAAEVAVLEVTDGVATVVLNRPEVKNALSTELIRALRRRMEEVGNDSDIRVVVLTGAGDAFCSGLDLRELQTTGENLVEANEPAAAGRPWAPLTKPVIGAVNGPAYTGGLELALHCDVLIGTPSARFADTHARVGVMPGWGMDVLLSAAVGTSPARAMSLTGLPIDAATALRLGLLHEVVSPQELLPRARQLADAIVQSDPSIVAAFLTSYRALAGRDGSSA